MFDNNPQDPRLSTSWGFAAWVEVGNQTILFDAGDNGDMLLGNLTALGLDPRTIDIVVLSHSHSDHTAGLAALLAVHPNVTVYLLPTFAASFKDAVRSAGATLVEVVDPVEILPGAWSTGSMEDSTPEQALVLRTDQGVVVITGCAHPGIAQVVERARDMGGGNLRLAVGGFHLGDTSPARIQQIIEQLQELGLQWVAPCHCTGDLARQLFRQAYGQDYYTCGAGWQWAAGAVE